MPAILDEFIGEGPTFRHKLSNQRLGMLQGLTGSDQPDFVFFEHKHHVVAGLEPECFAVSCRNNESAPSVEVGLDGRYKPCIQ